jgi:hypothetical protein
MDFLDKCIAHHFKGAGDHKTAFFPFLSLTGGYILPDSAKKNAISQFLKIFYIVFAIALVISILSDFALLIAVLIIGGLWYWAHTSMLTKGLPTTDKKKGKTAKDTDEPKE